MAQMSMTTINAQITGDLWPGGVANNATPQQADRTGGDGPCDSPQGCVRDPFLRSGSDRREDNSGDDHGKRTKCPH